MPFRPRSMVFTETTLTLCTVMADVPVLPPLAAVIVAEPAPTPVTSPLPFTVAFVNASHLIGDSEVIHIMNAVQAQIDRQLTPYWGISAKLVFFPGSADPRSYLARPVDRGPIQIVYFADVPPDQGIGLSYHTNYFNELAPYYKPLQPPVLRALLDRALGIAHSQRKVVALTRQLREAGRIGEMVGNSRVMQDIMRLIEQNAGNASLEIQLESFVRELKHGFRMVSA